MDAQPLIYSKEVLFRAFDELDSSLSESVERTVTDTCCDVLSLRSDRIRQCAPARQVHEKELLLSK